MTPVMVRFLMNLSWGLKPASHAAADETNQRKHEKDDEADLGNPGGRAGDSGESENGRNQRDDEEDNGVVKHGVVWVRVGKACGWAFTMMPRVGS
jgi:hypothetical protein